MIRKKLGITTFTNRNKGNEQLNQYSQLRVYTLRFGYFVVVEIV